MKYQLHHGDCLEILPTLEDCSVDAIVTDPTAGIAFMGSGSTGKAAIIEDFKFIGIEREADYIEIAKARLEAAVKYRSEFLF